MATSLSTKEIQLAKSYIVWRSIRKALRQDQLKLGQTELGLTPFYQIFIERVTEQVQKELHGLSRYLIRVQRTEQPTIWEVKIGGHKGDVEVNVIEMILALEHLVFKSEMPLPPRFNFGGE